MSAETDKSNIEVEFNEVDSKGAWPLLYQHIRNQCVNYDYTVQEARKTQNKNLNRYRDVSPYDHSRVVLSKGNCDYINANLVVMQRAHRRYILTQGPLPHTTGHFWLMVWEQNCKAVLMLNRIIEKKQVKCHQYWPLGTQKGVDDDMILSDVGLKVQYVSEEAASYYTTRVLRLIDMESGNSREILHFHYTTWPDFGVPPSPTAFLNFLMVVRESGALNQNVGPPVVHCSAGIGRSGTFCLVDSCLVLIEENGITSVNVREILLEMRKFRMGLIQTPDQLRFSYVAIIEGAKRLTNSNNLSKSPSTVSINENAPEVPNSQFLCHLEEGENEESPPLPPPRGESLKKSLTSAEEHDLTEPDLERELESPPDKPLPVEPLNSVESIQNELLSEVRSRLEYGDAIEPMKTLHYENDVDTASSGIRQRKADERKDRKERLSAQLREIKRKQEEAENWQRLKDSLFTPFNIGVGVGVGIILLGGGIFAYMYYSNKI